MIGKILADIDSIPTAPLQKIQRLKNQFYITPTIRQLGVRHGKTISKLLIVFFVIHPTV